ncbi:Kv channel-interacting protein 4-like isoform X2 [Ostrinia furnacalis]|uniref:Kv channel-interacting protein 4-like isoform X2 n=1 Tax=Ostrinia furnacalis TaxID=93504 RepID=UPI00103EE135|nr:Kv channel-interacting protein 4-like isoform X2 [Ostrinia furnacalis]
MVKNVVGEGSSDSEVSRRVSVKQVKSSLAQYKKNGKRIRSNAKKRVTFSDDQSPERVPFWQRFVGFFHLLWSCTRTSVQTALHSELEELGEQLPRYRPDSIAALRRATRFTEPELKRLYRGFKAECPTGVVKEDTFKVIYSQFFPQGANTAQYAHFVFNTLDQDRSGLLSFEEFVTGLSILSRGTLEEKLRWTFSLYDINGDGYITKEEMTEIVNAIYDLMGRIVDPSVDEEIIREKVERLFQKMDLNRDGVLTLDEFLDCCLRDEDISRSMGVFDSNF